MEDNKIIELYWRRDEEAIRETAAKYGRLCGAVARSILASREDVEECVSDTWLSVWRSIPEDRPVFFGAYVSRITRNIALNRLRYLTADKRNADAVCSLEELGECVSGRESPESEAEARRIEALISEFLRSQEEYKRVIFIRRYWYFDSLQRISDKTGFSQGKIKSILFRTRQKLREFLESEGVEL